MHRVFESTVTTVGGEANSSHLSVNLKEIKCAKRGRCGEDGGWQYRQRQVTNSLLAVSTPGGKELHQPHITAVQNHLVKVVICELHHILLTAATTTTLLVNMEQG